MNSLNTTRPGPPAVDARPATSVRRCLFFSLCALLCVASTALTVILCLSMSAAGEMPMSGGWSMSMTWSRMGSHGWPYVAASFTAMWTLMMVAMMLPSFTPILWRYHCSVVRQGNGRAAWLTVSVSVGYFCVWTLLGALVFPPGAMLAALEMQWPALASAVPAAVGIIVMIAGMLQLSAWKAHHLACYREKFNGKTDSTPALTPVCTPSPAGCPSHTIPAALQYGLRQGLHCVCCCAGPTAVLLAAGVMDPQVMALLTAAISAERLLPSGQRVARALGLLAIATGLLILVRLALSTSIAPP